jgi:ferritin-like metal-binding protein YciE
MMGPLHEMFLTELRDSYDAEQQLVKALPKLAKAASHPQLRQAFESHLAETKEHVARLERAFELLGEKAKGETCAAMKGLVKEGSDMIGMKGDLTDSAVDAGLIGAAQKVEHYEIASYGTLVAWSQTMEHDDVTALLEETLGEEKAANEKLNSLAESGINEQAMAGATA